MPADDPIAVLIPWYANDSLSSEERRQVEAHLPGCAGCRGLLEEARTLEPLGHREPEELLDHAQAQHLESFAADPRSMSPELTAWVGDHVQACEVCRDALRILARTLAGSETHDAVTVLSSSRDTPERRPEADTGSIWNLLSRTLLHPAAAAAYLVALALAIPVYRAIVPLPDVKGGAVDLQVLSSAFRGDEHAAVAVVEAGQPVFPLGAEFGLPFDLDAATVIRVVIRGGADKVVWSHELAPEQIARNLDHSGIVTLLLPGSRFSPGLYRLTVERDDRPDGRPLLDAPFEIVVREP